MRISDWSSDVCSSDLVVFHHLSLRRSAAGRGGGPGKRHRRPGKRHRRAVIADRAGVAQITGRLGGPPAPSVVPLQPAICLVHQVLGTPPGRGVLLQPAAGMLGASARLLVFATADPALGPTEGGLPLLPQAAVTRPPEPPA